MRSWEDNTKMVLGDCESVNGNRLTHDWFTKGYPYDMNEQDVLFTFNLFQ
jgi:hypothetical protein